jgi:hypothetical protein
MPTTDAKTGTLPTDAAFEGIKDLNEQFLTAARSAGNLYLDSYEKAVDRTIGLEVELAGLSRQDWLRDVVEAQADLAREITSAYTTTARSLLR